MVDRIGSSLRPSKIEISYRSEYVIGSANLDLFSPYLMIPAFTSKPNHINPFIDYAAIEI